MMRVIFFIGIILSGLIALASLYTLIMAFVSPDSVQSETGYRAAGFGVTVGFIFLTRYCIKKFQEAKAPSLEDSDILDL